MADLKSFNATPIVSSSTRRARMIGGAATAAATAVLALMVVLDFNGCSSASKNAQVNPASQNVSGPNTASAVAATSQPVAQAEKKVEAVIEKKKTIKRISTATYKNSAYGMSFRYPKTYTMLVPDAEIKDSAWPDPVAMNFAEPAGEKRTALGRPGTRAADDVKTTVKIKSDPVPVVATSEPAAPTVPASNPQQ